MLLDQQSPVILSLGRTRRPQACARPSEARLDTGRLTNFALMVIVLALAALWLVFPPVQLSTSPASPAVLAQDLLAKTVLR